MIPFIDLGAQQARIRDKVDAGIAAVLGHGAYIMGPEVGALEERLAAYAGVRHCISCSSGTDALILALLAQGLRPGQGVIVPSFTFAASAEVMPVLGAVPVFAEVDGETFNLDPAGLPAALEAGQDPTDAEQLLVKQKSLQVLAAFGSPSPDAPSSSNAPPSPPPLPSSPPSPPPPHNTPAEPSGSTVTLSRSRQPPQLSP